MAPPDPIPFLLLPLLAAAAVVPAVGIEHRHLPVVFLLFSILILILLSYYY